MLLRAHKCGFLLILAFCSLERISSSPQRNLRQNVAANTATVQSAANQTSAATRQVTRLTESYLPAVMQAVAYHIELLQYEPTYSTTIEPPFNGPSSAPPTFPNLPPSSPHPPAQQQPGAWWSSTTKPTTWWTPPSTTTTQKPTTTSWWNTQSSSSWWNPEGTTEKPWYAWTQSTTTTQKPTTSSWWNKPTTQKPVYSWTQSPPSSSWFTTSTEKPSSTSWWDAQSTTSKKPSYSWSFAQWPPTQSWQSTTSHKPWVSLDEEQSTTTSRPTTTPTLTPSTSTSTSTTASQPAVSQPAAASQSPSVSQSSTTTTRPSTTTPSWWHQETTPFHKPGYFAPDRLNEVSYHPVSNRPINTPNNKPITWKPIQPQVGDLSFLSISNLPYFSHFVQPNSKSFVRKPEYEYLHQYPAELLQDIENEAYERPKANDQDVINDFRRTYDDFFARVRVFSPITGKKRVPPTRPYVLFLIFYDLCKREAKRLNLQEFTGYSEAMLAKLHATSQYSSEHQLYTLLSGVKEEKKITATDFNSRLDEILEDLINPNSVTSMALHILPPLKFEP